MPRWHSSEADASGLEPLGSALALDVDERGSGADAQVVEAREQVVAQVARLPEHNDPMEIDPWYWQGIVTYEYMPEVPGVNDVIPMEVDVGEPVLDVVMAEPDGALATQVGAPLEEHNDMEVREEDVVMAERLPGGDGDVVMAEMGVPGEPMEADAPNRVEAQEHLDRGVDPDVQMADAVGVEAPSSGGDHPVMSESREEGANEAAVLNRGASAAAGSVLPAPRSEEGRRPVRKITLVLNKTKAVLNKVAASAPLPAGPSDDLVKHRKVLIPARGRNKRESADRSQDVGPSNCKGKHRVGCTCASCAEEAEDLEEQQAILASFDKSEEEESDDDANVPESSTAAMRRTDRRSRRSGSKAE
jgi:hypothetical protein